MIFIDSNLPLDWVAISAVATALMTLVTFLTLIQNRKQLNELKRQWHEANKAKLIFSIIFIDNFLLCLEVKNIGNSLAENIKFSINDSFLDKLIHPRLKETFVNLNKQSFFLKPYEKKQYLLCHTRSSGNTSHYKLYDTNISIEQSDKNYDELINEPIIIEGKYNNAEIINQEFKIKNFITHSIIDYDNITKGLNKIANALEKKSSYPLNDKLVDINDSL